MQCILTSQSLKQHSMILHGQIHWVGLSFSKVNKLILNFYIAQLLLLIFWYLIFIHKQMLTLCIIKNSFPLK